MKNEQAVKKIFSNVAEEHFQKAYESFLRKDMRLAVKEIRKGSSFMKREAIRATEEGKKILDKSTQGLEILARDLEKGVVTSAEEIRKGSSFLKREVTRAAAEGDKILDKSVQDLEALAHDLEKGVVISEEKVKSIFDNSSIARCNQLKASKLITLKK